MAEVIWTREALRDLAAIRSYIEQFDPQAAAGFAARLHDAAESLAEYPRKGRSMMPRSRLPNIRARAAPSSKGFANGR